MNSSIFSLPIFSILISIILVRKYGLIGVAIGTLLAMIYRTVEYIFYLSKNIIQFKKIYFLKLLGCSLLTFILGYSISDLYFSYEILNYFDWFVSGIINVIIFTIVSLIIYGMFNYNDFVSLKNKLLSLVFRKKVRK